MDGGVKRNRMEWIFIINENEMCSDGRRVFGGFSGDTRDMRDMGDTRAEGLGAFNGPKMLMHTEKSSER